MFSSFQIIKKNKKKEHIALLYEEYETKQKKTNKTIRKNRRM